MKTEARTVYDEALVASIAAGISSAQDFAKQSERLAGIYRPEPSAAYQRRDWKIVDYRPTRIAGLDYAVRGPVPDELEPGRYFVTLGSSISYGTCCQQTYGAILSRDLGLPVLNLSFAGASPEFFVKHHAEGVRHWLSGAAFTLIEVMASRSISNSRFASVEGRRKAIDLERPGSGPVDVIPPMREWVDQGKTRLVAQLIRESLQAHETLFAELAAMSAGPVIGLWLSKRAPDVCDRAQLADDLEMIKRALVGHPHFSDRQLVDALSRKCAAFVEVTSSRGLPSAAVNRFTGEPDLWYTGRPLQSYYSSDEMHAEAAAALLPAVRKVLGSPVTG